MENLRIQRSVYPPDWEGYKKNHMVAFNAWSEYISNLIFKLKKGYA